MTLSLFAHMGRRSQEGMDYVGPWNLSTNCSKRGFRAGFIRSLGFLECARILVFFIQGRKST